MRDLRWMKAMCDPLRAEKMKLGLGSDNIEYALIATPWSMEFMGQEVTVAATSNTVVAVLGRSDIYAPAPRKIDDALRPFLGFSGKGSAATYEVFKEWCGETWTRALPCPECDGQWAWVCPMCWGSGKAKSNCAACGFEHECRCRSCEGKGIIYCRLCTDGEAFEPEYGVIGDHVFSRSAISRSLIPRAVDVLLRVEDGKLKIEDRAQQWLVVVSQAKIGHKKLPRWKL